VFGSIKTRKACSKTEMAGGNVHKKKNSKNRQKKNDRAELVLQTQLQSFHSHYASFYNTQDDADDDDRWNQHLQPALMQPVQHCALLNRRVLNREFVTKLLDLQNSNSVEPLELSSSFPTESDDDAGDRQRGAILLDVYVRKKREIPDEQPSLESCPPNVGVSPPSNTTTPEVEYEENHNCNNHYDNDDGFDEKQQNNIANISKDDGLDKGTYDDEGEEHIMDENDADYPSTHNQQQQRCWPSPSIPSSIDPQTGLRVFYPMDAASLLPVILLDIQPHHAVLDMCAAPGGKALAVAQLLGLKPEQGGYLECNDTSPNRKMRLSTVLKAYIPHNCIGQTSVTLGDGTSHHFVTKRGRLYDRVLVDAPCTSERHLLHELTKAQKHSQQARIIIENAKEFMKWSPNQVQRNADRQCQLLLNALALCVMGGKVVYSTCALSRTENDGVIERVLLKLEKKQRQRSPPQPSSTIANESSSSSSSSHFQARILTGSDYHFDDSKQEQDETMALFATNLSCFRGAERTRFGWQILPDRTGWGPIYAAVLQKVQSTTTAPSG
jgi:16S rRNA C967 or C1407 C5-methylase (RsmB/RsmF family)